MAKAKRASKPAGGLSIPPKLVEALLLGPEDDRKLLQDTPILGDVWLAYAEKPAGLQDLLVTPHKDATSGQAAKLISDGIDRERPSEPRRVAYLQGIVAARLFFDEVLLILVPATQWWQDRNVVPVLRADFKDPAATAERIREVLESAVKAVPAGNRQQRQFTALDRYMTLAGLILWAKDQPPANATTPDEVVAEVRTAAMRNATEIADLLAGMFAAILKRHEAKGASVERKVFQVSLNRRAMRALDRSISAVKGDAAKDLFKVTCSRIGWAVLDSGIDRNHDAFITNGDKRVRQTFDFRYVREIVSVDADSIGEGMLASVVRGTALADKKAAAKKLLRGLADDARADRRINWGIVRQFVELSDPERPRIGHGTHVAGIIGGRKPEGAGDDARDGMCPDIRLYDFRVLGDDDASTEFAVMAALQFIRYLNEQHSSMVIHGANLSLSIPHNVRNYACGRTPVCDECDRLSASGVVVVAAAGNFGYQRFETRDGLFENYAAFSITDPGNADGVITVGSTHGHAPHSYGVSFFSSRGPTGDGRMKPDLVAPGERIRAPLPGNQWGEESGTSMAAPHVSGAAAMLMARYAELIGQPQRVKRILCESATDLGRERSFQGAGLLDVLRAFQRV